MDDENAQIEIAETVDALGLLCPLPVLRARKRLQALAPGAVLRLLASDPAAVIDVPHFCNQSGHAFLGCEELDGHQAYLIRKAL
ncbi:sulfurtransferase TusA family protein [Pseudodonghicola sp.]|uniref:sulfurtransferase TusA family protein n=1 Tax=Pseudodonghicola sp. TaxID=1969463 RepID=UPI003A9803CF